MTVMNLNFMTTIASCRSIAAVFALGLFTSSAPAQSVRNPQLDGVYNGSYTGEQGLTKFKLTITRQDDNGYHIGSVLTLYVPEGSGTKAYTCDLDGTYVSRGGLLQLRRRKWETAPPSGIDMVGLNGSFNPGGGNGAGQVSGVIGGGRTYKFQAIRDAAESAKIASTTADAKEAGAPAIPVARPGRRSTVATSAAPSASSSTPVTSVPPTAIDGVYAGTYGSNADDKVRAKLYVKFIKDGSVNGTLSGLFTFDVPLSGAAPVTYTYKLIGTYDGAFDLWSAKPLGKPAPDAYALKSLHLGFARGPWPSINPDQISGPVIGINNRPGNTFEATRDKAELANLDSLMAAQARAAGAVVSVTAPAAPAVQGVRPTIEGVFNGTYTRKNEPPARFKLTMMHTRYDGGVSGITGLAGVATIYLPTDSGMKAYTYSLTGTEEANGHFVLHVHDWETVRPKYFENFAAMGFDGTFLSNVTQNTARIINTQTPDHTLFVPKFEAAWDPTESADIKGTLAAQKAVRDADQVAALKEHAGAVKNAPPKQLASKYLVRKSQAYWSDYRYDLIRQIFDGGFADDVNENLLFQSMFINYVDLFSKDDSAYLPANRRTITIITTTLRDGRVVKTESKTIKIDPRFIPKYREFSGVDPDPGSPEAAEAGAKDIQIMRRVLQAGTPAGADSTAAALVGFKLMMAHGVDVALDMDRFFKNEAGSSAAMRQLGENFLRGAMGEPSLQEAGAKIRGAEAETDKNLPPGRFTHLIDAANAFSRDPANAQYRSPNDTIFYMLLAEKYRGVMTPDEEYYYANDFAVRFRDQIMGPRANSTDPAWPRLHPAVEESLNELGR
jgi:hypothetical protein